MDTLTFYRYGRRVKLSVLTKLDNQTCTPVVPYLSVSVYFRILNDVSTILSVSHLSDHHMSY